MGLVEQSQVVASTAVVVAMVTLLTARFVAGHSLGWMDFVSVVTVGSIGYVSVYFSLKFGRMLEEQRRELHELNSISDAVNHSVEIDYVLNTALVKVTELMRADCGWLYLIEPHGIILKHQTGTFASFFRDGIDVTDEALQWVRRPAIQNSYDPRIIPSVSAEFTMAKIRHLAVIPLVRQGGFAGVLIIGSHDERRFHHKTITILQAFGNQISLALNNAWLFAQVKESERQYADLYENSPDMYHSVDKRGIVVSCNDTECQLLGKQKHDIVGHRLLNLYPESDHERVARNLQRIFYFGHALRGVEEQILRADGTPIDVSLNTSLVYDADGKPVIARMVLRDITIKKKMDEKIQQAQKIDSIGNLTAGIAHNFNNILTAILGSASIMRRKINGDERLLKYVDLIESTSRRGADMTRQLGTFARKNVPHFNPVDLNSVLDQTLRLFEATSPKSIHVKCTLSPEVVIVMGDETQLQQALLNLCLNAKDAMPNGGVLVANCRPIYLDEDHAGHLADAKPGEYIMVTIADSGVGIPHDNLNRIFEPMFTTKDPGKGTGLGLSVAYGVIRSHDGYINVNSELDSGTIFTIYFPRATAGAAPRIVATGGGDLPCGTERILLVEDEISVGEVGADILKELGYSIESAHNGREAIHKLTNTHRQFELVILDMNMPRMGGKATFERIKELFPDLKVIVCSGYSATMIDDGTFAQAIDGFIQKPYELEEIARTIRQTLDQSSAVRPE